MLTLAQAASHFQGVQQIGAKYKALCPVHGDHTPSLELEQGDTSILITCWSRHCDFQAIIAAAGLTMDDVNNGSSNGHRAPPKQKRTWESVEAYVDYQERINGLSHGGTWEYRTRDERVSFCVVRLDPPEGKKQIAPMHPVEGGWQFGDPPGKLPLYNLDRLAEGRTYILEGEKCAEQALSLNLNATTSSHGSDSAHKTDWSPLAGREVVIVPDADDPGEKYVADVRKLLLELQPPAIVKTLRLPGLAAGSGDDLVEFVEARDSLESEAIGQLIAAMADECPTQDVAQPLSRPADPLEQGAFTGHAICVGDLVQQNPTLNQPVMEGLLRECELMNIISAPKIGKSWLVLSLALSVVTGRPWLGRYQLQRGPVLLIDNELHATTLAGRVKRVSDAMGIDLASIGPNLQIEVMRGRLQNLLGMRSYFEAIEPGRYKIIILDALYRLLPPGLQETDSGGMAGIYNVLDYHAQRLRSAFVTIHHSSKGNQSEKAITDVGSGSGVISRAVDTHFILRQHAEDGAVCVEGATRSWPPPLPFCMRWNFPVWELAEDLDPANLKRPGQKPKTTDSEQPQTPDEELTLGKFITEYVSENPQPKSAILTRATINKLSRRRACDMLALAVSDGLVFEWPRKHKNEPVLYSICLPDLSHQKVSDD